MHHIPTDGVVTLSSSCWDIITSHKACVLKVTSNDGMLVERFQRVFITATDNIIFSN
jgi:hypothetical protein